MTSLEELRRITHNKRWKNKISALEKEELSDDDELITDMKKNIIIKKKEVKKQIIKENKENIDDNKLLNLNPNDITPMFNEIDKYIYKCEWSKLRDLHKIVKLKDYVNSLKMKKDKKIKIISLLEYKLKNKELKNKQIIYIPSEETIKKIYGVSELDEYQSSSSDSEEEEQKKIVKKPSRKKPIARKKVINKKKSIKKSIYNKEPSGSSNDNSD
jgi:hypothetical protein